MNSYGSYLFHEEQDFRRPWIIFLMVAVNLGIITFQIYILYQQLYLGIPYGDTPETNQGLVISSVMVIVTIILVSLFIFNMRLITEVRQDGFYYRYPILISRQKSISKEDIVNYEVGKYHPIRDYGGWGVRMRFGRRRAYSVTGRQAVKFYLRNGKTILFGTQQPQDLKRALDRMMNPSNL